jgi:hypothetical protein
LEKFDLEYTKDYSIYTLDGEDVIVLDEEDIEDYEGLPEDVRDEFVKKRDADIDKEILDVLGEKLYNIVKYAYPLTQGVETKMNELMKKMNTQNIIFFLDRLRWDREMEQEQFEKEDILSRQLRDNQPNKKIPRRRRKDRGKKAAEEKEEKPEPVKKEPKPVKKEEPKTTTFISKVPNDY